MIIWTTPARRCDAVASARHPQLRRPGLTRLASGLLCAILLAGLAAPAVAAGDDDFFTHLHTEKAMANVTVSPGRAGPVEIAIQLETMEEKPLSAKAVSVTLTDTQTGKRLPPVQATRTGEADWHVKIPMLTAGNWMLGLGISITDTEKVNVESPIPIK
jgi:copper transport protein